MPKPASTQTAPARVLRDIEVRGLGWSVNDPSCAIRSDLLSSVLGVP